MVTNEYCVRLLRRANYPRQFGGGPLTYQAHAERLQLVKELGPSVLAMRGTYQSTPIPKSPCSATLGTSALPSLTGTRAKDPVSLPSRVANTCRQR
jgi:hypothetical protein